MNFYPQNITIGIVIFYLTISYLIGLFIAFLINLIAKYLFNKKINFQIIVIIFSAIFFSIFMLLVLSEGPRTGGR